MENRLRQLFDFQRFQGNTALQSIIDATHERVGEVLDDSDLEFLNAAGDPNEMMMGIQNLESDSKE